MTEFSFQLYSAREFPPLAETFSIVKDAGYTQVEGYGPLYADLAATRAALDVAGLSMPSGHFALQMLEDDEAGVLRIVEALGIKAIYCPFLLPDQRPADEAGWIGLAERLEALAKVYTGKGYAFGWHNHEFELVPLADGAIPLKVIFDHAPSVSWEADIAWVVRGGADPFEWIKTHGNRISAVHLKDIAANGECAEEDGWADVGHGTMDWKGLMAALKATPAKLFIMEHDKPSDVKRFANRSIQASKSY